MSPLWASQDRDPGHHLCRFCPSSGRRRYRLACDQHPAGERRCATRTDSACCCCSLDPLQGVALPLDRGSRKKDQEFGPYRQCLASPFRCLKLNSCRLCSGRRLVVSFLVFSRSCRGGHCLNLYLSSGFQNNIARDKGTHRCRCPG